MTYLPLGFRTTYTKKNTGIVTEENVWTGVKCGTKILFDKRGKQIEPRFSQLRSLNVYFCPSSYTAYRSVWSFLPQVYPTGGNYLYFESLSSKRLKVGVIWSQMGRRTDTSTLRLFYSRFTTECIEFCTLYREFPLPSFTSPRQGGPTKRNYHYVLPHSLLLNTTPYTYGKGGPNGKTHDPTNRGRPTEELRVG